MSNVLIGIIGVILFIGLALAGALFLGDRFQQTRNTSVGAASVQAVDQISNAINLSNAQEGTPLQAGTDPQSLRVSNYLKAIPVNPTGGEASRIVTLGGEATGGDGRIVVMRLAGADKDVCQAIARQTADGRDTIGQDGIVQAEDATKIPTGPAGCFHAVHPIGSLAADAYYAFSRP